MSSPERRWLEWPAFGHILLRGISSRSPRDATRRALLEQHRRSHHAALRAQHCGDQAEEQRAVALLLDSERRLLADDPLWVVTRLAPLWIAFESDWDCDPADRSPGANSV